MSRIFSAQEEYKSLKVDQAQCEEAILAALQSKDKLQLTELEETLRHVQERMEEMRSIIEFNDAANVTQSTNDLYCAAYCSERSVPFGDGHFRSALSSSSSSSGEGKKNLLALGLDDFARDVNEWSLRNQQHRITSVTLATSTSFFGIIEGPRQSVLNLLQALSKDTHHQQFEVIASTFVAGRLFNHASKLVPLAEDPLLGFILDQVKLLSQAAKKYTPAEAIDINVRGGDALTIPPRHETRITLAVMLDALCGAVHRAERYRAAALEIEAAVVERGGAIVDRFGEFMTATFPIAAATDAMHAATRVLQNIKYAIVAVHAGPVVSINAPHCTAVGKGLRDVLQLLYLAERLRRPIVISAPVYARSSKAIHRFANFTEDTILYHTLQHVDDTRLETPPMNDDVGVYIPGPEPELAEVDSRGFPVVYDGSSNQPRRATTQEIDARRRQEARVHGAVTELQLRMLFRKLDPGNVGWASKNQVLKFAETDPESPMSGLDRRLVESWLERCNKLGDERVGIEEFIVLCFKAVKL